MRYLIKKIVTKFNNWLSDCIEIEQEHEITISVKNKAVQTEESKEIRTCRLFGAYSYSMLPNNGSDKDIEVKCLASNNYSGCLMETITTPLNICALRIFGENADKAEKNIDIYERFNWGKCIMNPLCVKDYADNKRLQFNIVDVKLKENIIIDGRRSLEFELDGGEEKTIVLFFKEKLKILKSEHNNQKKLYRKILQQEMMKELGKKYEPKYVIEK